MRGRPEAAKAFDPDGCFGLPLAPWAGADAVAASGGGGACNIRPRLHDSNAYCALEFKLKACAFAFRVLFACSDRHRVASLRRKFRNSAILCSLLLVFASIGRQSTGVAQSAKPSIHFSFRPIAFSLDSSETPQRHAPETMAGGVAVFDYDHDGNLDIFFANGADIADLKKTSPRYSNRLFRNNGDGTFTDVTEKAGRRGYRLRHWSSRRRL